MRSFCFRILLWAVDEKGRGANAFLSRLKSEPKQTHAATLIPASARVDGELFFESSICLVWRKREGREEE